MKNYGLTLIRGNYATSGRQIIFTTNEMSCVFLCLTAFVLFCIVLQTVQKGKGGDMGPEIDQNAMS